MASEEMKARARKLAEKIQADYGARKSSGTLPWLTAENEISDLLADFAAAERALVVAEVDLNIASIGIEELKFAGLGYLIAADVAPLLEFVRKRLRALTASPEKEGMNGCC